MKKRVAGIVSALGLAERLKSTLRHSWTSTGRHESVAEHSWRLSLMALFVGGFLSEADQFKLLKMTIVHDLVEAIAGDVPAFDLIGDAGRGLAKREAEEAAMARIAAMLPAPLGAEIATLWDEFEFGQSYEARVAKALDKLEAQLQHNEADMATWIEPELAMTFRLGQFTRFDPFLDALRQRIEEDGAAKLARAGFDVAALRAKMSAAQTSETG